MAKQSIRQRRRQRGRARRRKQELAAAAQRKPSVTVRLPLSFAELMADLGNWARAARSTFEQFRRFPSSVGESIRWSGMYEAPSPQSQRQQQLILELRELEDVRLCNAISLRTYWLRRRRVERRPIETHRFEPRIDALSCPRCCPEIFVMDTSEYWAGREYNCLYCNNQGFDVPEQEIEAIDRQIDELMNLTQVGLIHEDEFYHYRANLLAEKQRLERIAYPPGCVDRPYHPRCRCYPISISRIARTELSTAYGADRAAHDDALDATRFATQSQRPTPCRGCLYYCGEVHGGNQLVCAVHPSGPDGETCLDWKPSKS